MKTKPGASSAGGAGGGAVRAPWKRAAGGGGAARERPRASTGHADSGASSQCDTPPLTEKCVGVGAETVLCAAEQAGAAAGEVSAEAAAALAEDVSFKLRQLIHTTWVWRQCGAGRTVRAADVRAALRLADAAPAPGPAEPLWRLCHQLSYQQESVVSASETALCATPLQPAALPALSAGWVSEGAGAAGGDVPPALRNYCMHVSRALLKGSAAARSLALADIRSNPQLGPALPHLLNLAVLVLNDDNLNTLHVPDKPRVKGVILNMIEAVCANPCSLDTDVLKQLQRLYPALVAEVLPGGPLADRLVQAMRSLARAWPACLHVGEQTLWWYVRGREGAGAGGGGAGDASRVCGAVVRCAAALGARALRRCVLPHLAALERRAPADHALAAALADAATVLLCAGEAGDACEAVEADEERALAEVLGDALEPRRLLRRRDWWPPAAPADTAEGCEEDSSGAWPWGRTWRPPLPRALPAPPRRRPPGADPFERKRLRPRALTINFGHARPTRPRATPTAAPRAPAPAPAAGQVVVGRGRLHPAPPPPCAAAPAAPVSLLAASAL